MKFLKFSGLILFLISSIYASGDNHSINKQSPAEWEALYNKGNTVQTVGNILSYTGLSLSALGIYTQSGGMIFGGVVAHHIGVVANGIGTTQMVDATNGLNPNLNQSNPGWIPFWIAVGLDVVGFAMLSSQNSGGSNNNREDHDSWDVPNLDGLLPIAIGTLTTLGAWGFFSYSASKARKQKSSTKMSFSPLISKDQEGRLYGGLQTGFSF